MDAVLEAKSCRAELVAASGTMGNELEEARGELRQAEAQAALQQQPCPPPTQRPAAWAAATTPQSWNVVTPSAAQIPPRSDMRLGEGGTLPIRAAEDGLPPTTLVPIGGASRGLGTRLAPPLHHGPVPALCVGAYRGGYDSGHQPRAVEGPSLVYGAPGVNAPPPPPVPDGRDFTLAVSPDADSPEESSDEAATRRRKNTSALKVGKPPTASGFRAWVSELYSACIASSNRSATRTIRFISNVEHMRDPMELLGPPSKRWEGFDAVLYEGVMGFASADLKRQLTNYQQRCYAQRVAPSGRFALWHLLRKYAVSRGTAVQSDLSRLLNHKAAGGLSLYLDGLDNLLLNLDEPATETLLHSLVEPQLRTFKSMEQVFHIYDHAPDDARERAVQFLYDSARAVLFR